MQRKLEHPCPGCGAFARIFTNGQSTCAYCGATLAPLPFTHSGGYLPLTTPLRIGMRARIQGKEYVAIGRIGFTERDDDEVSQWEEWVLLSQDGEARYLEFDEGRWVLTQAWPDGPYLDPAVVAEGTRQQLGGESAICFSQGIATVSGIEGEIPWPVETGDRARYADFRAGQTIFSLEWEDFDGQEWYRGRQMPDSEVLAMFGLRTLAEAQERVETVKKDRAGFGCLLIVLSILSLIGWGVALNQRGRVVSTQSAMAASIPEEGIVFEPIYLTPNAKVHRMRLSTSGLSQTSLWAQAVLEDDQGPVLDADGEFWDETGYDDGYWHEWVTESYQDFRVAKAGFYRVRLRADPEQPSSASPATVRIEAGVLYPPYLAWYGFIALGLGFVFLAAGGSSQKAWTGMGTSR